MSIVELSPVVKSLELRRSAADAFRIFTADIDRWWPKATHTRAKTAEGQVTAHVTIEPRVGGRVYETLQDGAELEWGEVSAYEPGVVLAMRWRMGRTAEETTDVFVRFEPLSAQSCRVTLTHENWERMGEEAERLRTAYNNGWASVFDKHFAEYAAQI